MTIHILKGIFLGIFAILCFMAILKTMPKTFREKPLYYICFIYNACLIPIFFSCTVSSMSFMELNIPDHIMLIAIQLFFIGGCSVVLLNRLVIYSELQRKIAKGEIGIKSDIRNRSSLDYKAKLMIGFSVAMYIAYGYLIIDIIKLN